MSKEKVEVVIGGINYALQGAESTEHIKRVASIIDKKTGEVKAKYGTQTTNPSRMNMLVTLNIADEYVKGQDELLRYMKELEKCSLENMALIDKIKELTLDITELKKQVAQSSTQAKKVDTRRGR